MQIEKQPIIKIDGLIRGILGLIFLYVSNF